MSIGWLRPAARPDPAVPDQRLWPSPASAVAALSLIATACGTASEVSCEEPSSRQPAPLELATQRELTSLRGVRTFDSELTLIGPDIRDLSPLRCLETVESLTIRATSLVDLRGLGALESIGGDISPYYAFQPRGLLIQDNDALRTLAGLDTLHFSSGGIRLVDNDALRGLWGLEHFEATWDSDDGNRIR